VFFTPRNYRIASALEMGLLIIRVQKMTSKSANYFHYSPATPELRRWGLGVTASGCTRIAAGSAYPPERHPEDHQ
jgi:hypothetical protein